MNNVINLNKKLDGILSISINSNNIFVSASKSSENKHKGSTNER